MGEIKRATLKSFHSYEGDSMAYSKDYFERFKQEGCCELQGGQLKFYESGHPDKYTSTTVVSVEKRRGTNILILRCGPRGRMVLFLEFDTKRLTDEWQEALCRFTGQPFDPQPVLRRVHSEISDVKRGGRRMRTRSAFPDVTGVEEDGLNPDRESIESSSKAAPSPEAAERVAEPESVETLPETPPTPQASEASTPESSAAPLSEVFQPAAPVAQLDATPDPALHLPGYAGASSLEPADCIACMLLERMPSSCSEKSESDDRQPNSPQTPLCLRSSDQDISPNLEDFTANSVELKCNVQVLRNLKVKDWHGNIVVKESLPLYHLHRGDFIVAKTAELPRMYARELTELIRTTPESTTIPLTVIRGPVCMTRLEEQGFVICIKGSKTIQLDVIDAVRRACTSACRLVDGDTVEESNLVITEINHACHQSATEVEVAQKMGEALQDSKGILTLRMIPQSLMNYGDDEDEDDIDDESPLSS